MLKKLSTAALAAILSSAMILTPAIASEPSQTEEETVQAETAEDESMADAADSGMDAADVSDELESMLSESGIDGTGLDAEAEGSTLYLGISEDNFMDSVKASVLSGGLFSSTEYLDSIGAIDTSFDEMFDLASLGVGSVDTGYLNLAYESMVDSMNTTFDSIDLSGQSVSCMDLFSEKFGDVLDSVSISYAELPSGFDVWSMLGSVSDSVASTYSTATNTGSFAAYKNSIDISSIFAQAAAGPTTYPLEICSEALTWYDEQQSANEKNAYSNYAASTMITTADGNKTSFASAFNSAAQSYADAVNYAFGINSDGTPVSAEQARNNTASTYDYNFVIPEYDANGNITGYTYDDSAMSDALSDLRSAMGYSTPLEGLANNGLSAFSGFFTSDADANEYYRDKTLDIIDENGRDGWISQSIDDYNASSDDDLTVGNGKLLTELNLWGTYKRAQGNDESSDDGAVMKFTEKAIGNIATYTSNFLSNGNAAENARDVIDYETGETYAGRSEQESTIDLTTPLLQTIRENRKNKSDD